MELLELSPRTETCIDLDSSSSIHLVNNLAGLRVHQWGACARHLATSGLWFIAPRVLDGSIYKGPAKPCLSTIVQGVYGASLVFVWGGALRAAGFVCVCVCVWGGGGGPAGGVWVFNFCWVLGNNSVRFWYFPVFFNFLRSSKSFDKLWRNSYRPLFYWQSHFILLVVKEKFAWPSKSQHIMNMTVGKISIFLLVLMKHILYWILFYIHIKMESEIFQ